MYKIILILILNTITVNSIAQNYTIPIKPQNRGQESFNSEQLNTFINLDSETVISGFIANPKFNASEIQVSYFAEKSDKITGNFLLGNYTKDKITYRIMCLINYVQQRCRFNKKWSYSHDVTLTADTHRIFPVELLPLDEGAYDFLLLAIRLTQEDDINIDKQNNTDFSIISKRANIYIGNAKFPKNKYRKNILSEVNKFNEHRIVINNEKGINNFSVKNNFFSYNNILNKYVHISNQSNIEKNAVLIGFSNSRQINISDENLNLYFKQSQNSVSLIPIKNQMFSQKLTVILIENPYIVIEPFTGIFTKVSLDVRISNTLYN